MATDRGDATQHRGRRFPDDVPVLGDPAGRVLLRAHTEADLPAIVEQSNDPASRHWTPLPIPEDGYGLREARDFALGLIPAGWRNGTSYGWAIEAELDGPGERRYAGTIDLGLAGDGTAEVGFSLHPAARGRGVMGTALRLVRDYGLDVAGLRAIRWRARVGNWPSRVVAAAAGFRFDGTVRSSLDFRGELVDGWVATITATDDRKPIRLPETPVLDGDGVRLRPVDDADADRLVGICTDPLTRRFLPRLPDPYTAADALRHAERLRETAAGGHGFGWCFGVPDEPAAAGTITVRLEDSGRAEIGFSTHPDARGRGLTTAAVRAVAGFLDADPAVPSALIRCAASNPAARRVAERAGFALIGTQPASDLLGDGSLDDLLLFHRVCHTR